MRCLAVLTVCLLALVPAFDSASAASGKGSVQKAWISTSSGGTPKASFKMASVKRLYANFTWKTPAAAGQKLRIEWHGPGGILRAVWDDKTIKDDKKGTRLFAWIGSGVVKGKPGAWSAVLSVGGTKIKTHKFRIVA
jgi:hypothetical protein